MGRIHQLSDHVANQIAAGEVVERPAAVVKELVENAIDAGARNIEIEFRTGGKRYIRVTDDGYGMDPGDAELCLQRHATSKITETQDILRLNTFGFRGEALPSIASVSQFVLRTREKTADAGTEIAIDDQQLPVIRQCGMSPGTSIEVSRLFHNVPARRKFLKTDRTESAHIAQLCRLFAVAHPEIGFTVIEDGNLRLRSPRSPDLRQRIREIFGRQIAEDLMPIEEIDVDEDSAGVEVSGMIGLPGKGRATRAEMFTFVNKRPVDSRVLNYALIESYHTYIPKGRYPLSFLFVDVPPQAVDVNVHPTKREVRFREDGKIRQIVMSSVLHSLRNASRPLLQNATRVQAITPSGPPSRLLTHSVDSQPRQISKAPDPSDKQAAHKSHSFHEASKSDLPPPSIKAESSFQWRLLGTTAQRTAIFESTDGLICLHLRAAQERIIFEEMMEAMNRDGSGSQSLMFPLSLELDPVSADTLDQHLPFFHTLGFEVEEFGRNFYRVRSVPKWFEPEEALSLMKDIVALIRERGFRPSDESATQEAAAKLGARKAVRREKGVTEDPSLIARRLLRCKNPLADTSGRATFFEIPRREWRKRLGLDS